VKSEDLNASLRCPRNQGTPSFQIPKNRRDGCLKIQKIEYLLKA